MNAESVSSALEALDAVRSPRVHRFDDGPPFQERVAVLPSAFNPPTRAHLRLLDLARDVEGVTSTAVLLSTHNVDKGLYGATLTDRIGMLTALREAHPGLAVLASNAARIPDQAAALRVANPQAAFDFIVGYDTLVRVFEPRYYDDMERDLDDFFAHHRLFAANRGDSTFDTLSDFLRGLAVRPYTSRIVACRLEDAPSRLSSTAARAHAANGQPAPDTPPEVDEYIRRHGLYRDGSALPK